MKHGRALGQGVMQVAVLAVVSTLAAGCAAAGTEVVEASAPGAKADGIDAADHGCQIVLRTLRQPFGEPANSVDGVNWVVYTGQVDVADGAEGTPMVLFSSRSTTGWWQVEMVPVSGAAKGYHRYELTLDRNTVPMGLSSEWFHMRIDVVPFLETEGGRLFDHNRNPDDFDNYTLTAQLTSFADDPAVCH